MARRKKRGEKANRADTADKAPATNPASPPSPKPSSNNPVMSVIQMFRASFKAIDEVLDMLGSMLKKHPVRTVISLLITLGVCAGYFFPQQSEQALRHIWSYFLPPDPEEIRMALIEADVQLGLAEPSETEYLYVCQAVRAQRLEGDKRILYIWALVGKADCRRMRAESPFDEHSKEARSLYQQGKIELEASKALVGSEDARRIRGRLHYGFAALDFWEFNDLQLTREARKRSSLAHFDEAGKAFKEDPGDKGRVHIALASYYISEGNSEYALDELKKVADCRSNIDDIERVEGFTSLRRRDQVFYLANCARALRDRKEAPDNGDTKRRIRDFFSKAVDSAKTVDELLAKRLRVELANALLYTTPEDPKANTTDLPPFGGTMDKIQLARAKSRWFGHKKNRDRAIEVAGKALNLAKGSRLAGAKECQDLKYVLAYHYINRVNDEKSPNPKSDLDEAGALLCDLDTYTSHDAFDDDLKKAVQEARKYYMSVCKFEKVEPRQCTSYDRF